MKKLLYLSRGINKYNFISHFYSTICNSLHTCPLEALELHSESHKKEVSLLAEYRRLLILQVSVKRSMIYVNVGVPAHMNTGRKTSEKQTT